VKRFISFAITSAAMCVTTLPRMSFAAPQFTQTAEQCVSRQDFVAGTNNVPYPFSRFVNTCNVTISLTLTTASSGNNGPGEPGPGAFMVMNWEDGQPKPVRWFACAFPGVPDAYGNTYILPPSFTTSSYRCVVPNGSTQFHMNGGRP
jgi:hypothetical protein